MLLTRFAMQPPLQHISSGKLLTSEEFTHPRRQIDSFVLIIGLTGEIHICQDDETHTVGPGDVLVLSPYHIHYGAQKSTGPVSYYWAHFYPREEYSEDSFELYPTAEAVQHGATGLVQLPTFAKSQNGERLVMLFRQMLHMANRVMRNAAAVDYLLTVLLFEISRQWLSTLRVEGAWEPRETTRVAEIAEWIRVHLSPETSVAGVAAAFNYNPDYLNRLFKGAMGTSVSRFICQCRINKAKAQLLNSKLTVAEVAYSCGFKDEKYFMRSFKKEEDMTPTQFRNAFFYIHMNAR